MEESSWKKRKKDMKEKDVDEKKGFAERLGSGYMTVEAVMVLPMVMVALTIVIGLVIFQYNRCVLEQDMGIMALWGATANTTDAEVFRQEIEGKMEELYPDKYVLWKMEDLEAKAKYNSFYVKGTGSMGQFGTWTTEYDYKKLDQVDFIRLIDRMERTLEEGR